MKFVWLAAVCVIVLVAGGLFASRDTGVVLQDVPGDYELRTKQGVDTLRVAPDGRFYHKSWHGNVIVVDEEGTWSWEENPPEPDSRVVLFQGYTTTQPGIAGSGLWPAKAEKHWGVVRLIVMRDLDLSYRKVAPISPNKH